MSFFIMIKLHGGLRPTPSGASMVCGTFFEQYFTAKILSEPSMECVNGSQIATIEICQGNKWDGEARLFAFNKGVTFVDEQYSHNCALSLIEALEGTLSLRRMPGDKCHEFARISPELEMAS